MLDIEMKFKKGILIVRLKGILNGDTISILQKELKDIIENNGIKYVMLNLKRLSYIDKYGLESIKQSYNYIKSNKGKLILCGIDKLFESNKFLTENLYQVNDEEVAYEIVNI